MARNMYTSLLAGNRSGHCFFAPPNDLQLVLCPGFYCSWNAGHEIYPCRARRRQGLHVCSCLYGIRSLRPGCRALPPIVTETQILTCITLDTGKVLDDWVSMQAKWRTSIISRSDRAQKL